MTKKIERDLIRLKDYIGAGSVNRNAAQMKKKWLANPGLANLPDFLFNFFCIYNCGYFLLFNRVGDILEEINVTDVFGERAYDAAKIGENYSCSMVSNKIDGFSFFPKGAGGLVPILGEPSGWADE